MTVGEAALTGWRGSVGRAIAKPIAKRTRFDVEQIEAVLGLILLAYTIYRVGRPLIRAGRSTSCLAGRTRRQPEKPAPMIGAVIRRSCRLWA